MSRICVLMSHVRDLRAHVITRFDQKPQNNRLDVSHHDLQIAAIRITLSGF